MLQQKQRLVSPVVRVHGSASQGRPLQELLVLFSSILESTNVSGNLSLSFALISLWADDKVIGMNWNRLVVCVHVCVCVVGGWFNSMEPTVKSLRTHVQAMSKLSGVLCKPLHEQICWPTPEGIWWWIRRPGGPAGRNPTAGSLSWKACFKCSFARRQKL